MPIFILVLIAIFISTIFSSEASIEIEQKIKNKSETEEELVKVGDIHTLVGNLIFHDYKGKINFSELDENANRRDSISIQKDYIHVAKRITKNSYTDYIVYMNDEDLLRFSKFTFEDLKEKEQVVELVLKVEKLSENEWFCKKVLDFELKEEK
ncbi:hypothetical protein [Aureivirga sp. CE67]|uniref:hypothetical protein n=1 Tax=Aureivirga sp. CE67 TaxID=1788983 RepID=UPI0018CA91B8|nr:hypothetical protein [Aureivirga sp. CE67]